MINLMLRFVFAWLLVAFLSGCKDADKFDIYSYNGAYPRNIDGSQIETFEPQVSGGNVALSFNGHAWNHSPYIRVFAESFGPVQSGGIDELDLSVQAMVNNNLIEPCGMESLYLRVPLKEGNIDTKGLMKGQQQSDYIRFSSVNCDATKDRYELDLSRQNILRLVKFDSSTQTVEISMDLHFQMLDRNSDFGPIYPEKIDIKGTVKTMIRL